jgi:5-methylcytosine-specific restriction endonuclease McrA
MTSLGWNKIRAKILKRDNGICCVCRYRPAEEITHVHKRQSHHRPPASQDMDNMISVCKVCHPGFDARRDTS